MIRAATPDDLDTVCERAAAFHAYSPWRAVEFEADAVRAFAATIIAGGGVFLSDEGLCGGVIQPLYFNPAFKVAVELVWWAPSEGQALKAAFEEWARASGASAIQFSALGDRHLAAVTRIYGRAGYRLAEASFLKGL